MAKNRFFVGKIRRLSAFPWVTWAVDECKLTYGEVMEPIPEIEIGDIGLHRQAGYLENIAITGFMIHAWVHTEPGYNGKIVEAISEGVLHRNYLYAMYTDYVMILTPRDVTEKDREYACKKAREIVGCKYDADFKFDIEKELEYFEGKDIEKARRHLEHGQKNLQKYDPEFACTEVASFAWWHKREQLRLFRTEKRGHTVILADTFLNHGWKIKWMSSTVTVESAKKLGASEEAILMIEEYLKEKNKK